jgi:hypothetical protein
MTKKLGTTLGAGVVLLVAVAVLTARLDGDGPPKGWIPAAEAAAHEGERATVCGKVASTRYADRANGQPTFLNLDRAYPNQVFTALIWSEDRARFKEPPERHYRGRRICVTGKIGSYRGGPQIVVQRPDQIEIADAQDGR